MKGQGSFILKTILWTVIMILSLAGSLIGFIMLSVKDPSGITRSLVLAGIMAGLIGFAYALKQIILGEQQWKKDVIEEILQHPAQILATWHYPFKQWTNFKYADLKERRKAPTIATVTVMSFMLLGIGIGYFYEGMDNGVLEVTIPLIPLVGIMVWWITNANVAQIKKAYEGNKDGEIILAPKGAIINKLYLIPFEFFGGRLTRVRIEKHYEMDTLQFTVRVNAGHSTAYHHYHIPIPETRRFDAGVVKQQFQELYNLSS